MKRRHFIQSCAVVTFGGGVIRMGRAPHVVVVGAGAFGGWTALYLRRQGARVTLVDAWGPGNTRASSGGETRVIRATYGDRAVYTRLAARAMALWKQEQQRWRRRLFHATGVLWMTQDDDELERTSVPVLRDAGIAFEELSPADIARRYPQINAEGIRWAIFERDAGYLLARQACGVVLDAFLAEGGEYREAAVPAPVPLPGARGLRLSDGQQLTADSFVFACGPWLGTMFPDVIGDLVYVTRQEVFYFGTPPGGDRFTQGALPVWADHGAHFMYGIPGHEGRGFKIADDTRGPPFDPSTGDRTPTPEGLRAARDYLARRFPGLKGAPVLAAEVCQYENSLDAHLIVDRHPAAANVWIVGGGSGHGFKHGPAVGELVARVVLTGEAPDAQFRLSRFTR